MKGSNKDTSLGLIIFLTIVLILGILGIIYFLIQIFGS